MTKQDEFVSLKDSIKDLDVKHTSHKSTMPMSFAAPDGMSLTRRRALFSHSFTGISTHHVVMSSSGFAHNHDRRRYIDDYALRLIDDLTNRPVDPMFMDARLSKQPVKPFNLWFTRAIVFLLCVSIGTVGSQFVRKLHTDPRKAIRSSLANELSGYTSRFDKLVEEVTSLRNNVDHESQKITTPEEDEVSKSDDMVNGTHAVEGSGITLTIANPISASSDVNSGSLPRESNGARMRLVTDRDIQQFVSLLWEAGAEAISVNGHRLGAQTSIRVAGQTILIGVNQTQSPYVIEVIGDSDDLIKQCNDMKRMKWYASLVNAGINPQVSPSRVIRLSAANTGDISFANERIRR
ncbi:DUF881 domain-containing protein [Gardnerella swidsinskii]|jgi:conserved uncharacterized protein|nr:MULTISPECIES: DUF881 domain-containing protein [Gardnerella]PMC43960.1 2-dehydropantoate 2-reductase [Gardnerella vaginalis]RIY26058.1 DUF881 domain-containing protein [Bifidobacteriaceae bacterium WP021]RIY30018.1 DUF881 domain-containing protein [Bifidobacteriaceae bacterium NR016]MDK6294797.1 DUF881 domain-containing protein [Gardnerella swidsinskii]MDK7092979.1 DUF881 domain-containing protein [Gardnerella swidsinskii]